MRGSSRPELVYISCGNEAGARFTKPKPFYSPQKGPGNCTRPLPSASKAETGRAAVLSVFYELGGPAAQTAAGSDCWRGHCGFVGVL